MCLLIISIVCGLSVIGSVRSHSWVECTDYDRSINLQADDFDNTFDHSACSGYARDRKWYTWHESFGYNSGIDFEVFADDANIMCERSIGSPSDGYSSTYDSQYPMAQYTVGDTYRMIWPAKNHAGYECQTDQLDHQMQIWVNLETNPTSDLGNDVNNDGWTLVIDWHTEYEEETGNSFVLADCTDGDCSVQSYIGIDDVPFQNCPKFCDDTDAAVCYGDLTIPNIFPEDGYYTFVWYWEFKANEIYSHCFEAYVSGTESYTEATDEPDVETTNNGNFTGNNNSNKNKAAEDGEAASTILWAIVSFILIFTIIAVACVVLQKQGYIVCNENSISWAGSDGVAKQASVTGLAHTVGSGSTHAIESAGDGHQNATGATNSTQPPPARPSRPPRPPPLPTHTNA